METYQKIMNERLKAYYGTDASCSHSRFRLVFTDDLLEKRESEFGDPPVKEVREVKKYSYLTHCWMLEIHCPQQVGMAELKTFDHYEPLWTWNKYEYYCPVWNDIAKVVTAVIKQLIAPVKKNSVIIANEAAAAKQKEENLLYDVIQQGGSFLEQQLSGGEAVSFANVKPFKGES